MYISDTSKNISHKETYTVLIHTKFITNISNHHAHTCAYTCTDANDTVLTHLYTGSLPGSVLVLWRSSDETGRWTHSGSCTAVPKTSVLMSHGPLLARLC